jgi:hypothetical protein
MRTFKKIRLVNPKQPRMMKDGGYVHKTKSTTKTQAANDSVLAVLTPGELVIPKKHTRKIQSYLRKRRIRLPE